MSYYDSLSSIKSDTPDPGAECSRWSRVFRADLFKTPSIRRS